MHPHILIGLLGHDITDRLLAILDAGAQGDVNIELDRWSRAVKQAAERIRYDSQLEVARQLGVDSEPLPFNKSQRSACGKHYEDIPCGSGRAGWPRDSLAREWRLSGDETHWKLRLFATTIPKTILRPFLLLTSKRCSLPTTGG